jgi:hypothetical protein
MALAFIVGCSDDSGGDELSFPAGFIGTWVSEPPYTPPPSNWYSTTLEFKSTSITRISDDWTLPFVEFNGNDSYAVKDETYNPGHHYEMQITLEPDGKLKIEGQPFGGLKYTKQ